MKNSILFILVIVVGFFSCKSTTKNNNEPIKKGQIKIQWLSDLEGDYNFKNEWSYPEGVYRNEFGQLSCDGICPEESYTMKDSKGRIYNDSLSSFYRLVDTSHEVHSIQCNAWCYEWAGTNFIIVLQKNKDTVECFTQTNAATHCSLHLNITDSICSPTIELRSIIVNPNKNGNKIYNCTDGFIKIDKQSWEQGIMKAEFKFNFDNTDNPQQPMYWKGKIYTQISYR